MKFTYKNQLTHIKYISADHKYVLATVDPEMKVGLFKIDITEIEDKKILKELKKNSPIYSK